MTKNELIEKLKIILWITDILQDNKLDVELDSALAFVNSYTFRDYVFWDTSTAEWSKEEKINTNIWMVLIDFVKFWWGRKKEITSERLSDRSVVYSQEELPQSSLRVLDRYKVYNVA